MNILKKSKQLVPVKLKVNVKKAMLSLPHRVECNICGWKGRRFCSDYWHKHIICPNCSSQVRHRLLLAALMNTDEFSISKVVKDKHVIHFAPEHMLTRIFQDFSAKYVTADLFRKDVDMQLDMSDMITISNNSVDVVIAIDVLELVENDIRALQEIYRILSFGGWAILMVPQIDIDKTLEDPSVTHSEDRMRLFGDPNHRRIYGKDFLERLQSMNFRVNVIDESHFSEELVKKHVLFPPVLSEKRLATNYRKVYFAQKTYLIDAH